ncbi:phospho-N-acetylmuramoyl-pentapeptide-transferase homolog [Daucus carota subsp. sativus]|uniref:phospho-N-acetylmuramoyl-pentapeptide- transferase homolog n=1 Tax=Daucus carota subsp. sativus TaxID=79200 RepID=UPI0007EEF85B|nr:PREDICTED: phospho-N-acetylmuramoyl-pentapeptide-transferase homolog isoform X1 [Daucus carota subsp. sativus]
MRSKYMSASLCNLGFCPRDSYQLPKISGVRISCDSFAPSSSCFNLKLRRYGCCSKYRLVHVTAMDEDSVSGFDDWVGSDGAVVYSFSSSDGEDSDGEFILNPLSDVDMPTIRDKLRPEALTIMSNRLALTGKAHKKSWIQYGVVINLGLITFLIVLLLYADWCAWRIVRLPLSQFHLMRPFSTSAILVACAGYIGVPLLRRMKMKSIINKEGPNRQALKRGTPTMGGLLFVPIGVIVAEVIVGFSSIEVSAAAVATLSFAAIGLLDDSLSLINKHNGGLSSWTRILLEIAVGACFCYWLYTSNVSSPYSIKMVVPLPVPVGLVCLGNLYLFLTSFCFVSLANGVNLTDRLDGLAGGTAALALIGMSIAVLPICSDLAVFGASMAGACVGFLLHNRYKASVFMGDTGSLALGGALAAMAGCTGMFFPLFISSGIFVLETLSVVMQVSFYKTTKYLHGRGRQLFRMAPFHRHLELCGIKEPIIIAGAYVISSMLILCAGYIGLISV